MLDPEGDRMHIPRMPGGSRIVLCSWLAVGCVTRETSNAGQNPDQSLELPIIDQTHWHTYPVSEDPLPQHQPAQLDCSPAGYYLTPSIVPELELDTAYCNYSLLSTDAVQSLAPGAQLRFALRHFELLADEPAQAHVALFFGDALVWETYIDIPAPAQVAEFSFRIQRALAKGDPVRLHLHNHGQNTWVIGKLTSTR